MVDTYIDPQSGKPLDFGVESFLDLGNATGFLDRFGLERIPVPPPNDAATTHYVDFRTGTAVNISMPPIDAQMAAMVRLADVVKPWTSYIQPGYWDFWAPADVPQDLLIPYGDFVEKYGLEDAIPLIYQTTGMGLGNMTRQTTLFVLQAFGTYMAESMIGQIGSFAIKGGNQALYNAVEKDLGSDALYNSTVIFADRTDHGVFLLVQNHVTGHITSITARRLLVAIEPTASNTEALDLDPSESAILSKFTYSRLYTALVKSPALAAASSSYFNLPTAAAPHNYLVLPEFPFTNSFTYTGMDQLFSTIIVGDDSLDAVQAKAMAQENFDTLLQAVGQHGTTTTAAGLEWVDFAVHGPMHARVTPEEIKSGFFMQLYALQGQRSTWWTGGAFACNFQTTLWQFDEILIPKILAGLD